MRREGNVFFRGVKAGTVWQDEEGYGFIYDADYYRTAKEPVSFTLPLRETAFLSKTMLPFFDGLIPEGWLLDITVKNWKLDPKDRMQLLLTVCRDCLGAVSIESINQQEE